MVQTIRAWFSGKGLSPGDSDTAVAFYTLSRLLAAGVSLSDALEDLCSMTGSGDRQRLWKDVARSVSAGQKFSDAVAGSANGLDGPIVAFLKAGEANGQLDLACRSINQYLQWYRDLRERLLTILIYPLFTLCVLVSVCGFLLISVVPSIKGFLIGSGTQLEWHTLALLGLSEWIGQHYMAVLFVCLGLVSCLAFLITASQRVQRLFDNCLLHLPLLGQLIINLSISRYARVCSQLYTSGVPLEDALELAEKTVANQLLRTELGVARRKMLGGVTLAASLAGVEYLPALFIRLVAVGESSGQLAEALLHISEQQGAASQASISRLEQMIGPVLLMCVGSLLLWIVVSVLAPVYNVAITTVVGAS